MQPKWLSSTGRCRKSDYHLLQDLAKSSHQTKYEAQIFLSCFYNSSYKLKTRNKNTYLDLPNKDFLKIY